MSIISKTLNHRNNPKIPPRTNPASWMLDVIGAAGSAAGGGGGGNSEEEASGLCCSYTNKIHYIMIIYSS